MQCSNTEVGAGTKNPLTFLRVLGPEPWNVALDSLCGLFGAGCQPSSTNDPFGLRRISCGLVQLLVEKDKKLDLRYALGLAAEVQPVEVNAGTIEDIDKGISPEDVRSVLAERANWPSLAAKTAHKMDILLRGDLPKKVVEAYSRPTRIVRGKDVDVGMEVDEHAFETNEVKALWSACQLVENKSYSGIDVEDFFEISSHLTTSLNASLLWWKMTELERTDFHCLRRLPANLPNGIGSHVRIDGTERLR